MNKPEIRVIYHIGMEAVVAAGSECMTAGGEVVYFDDYENDNMSATSTLITIGSTPIRSLPAGGVGGFCFDVTTPCTHPLATTGKACGIKRSSASSCRSARSMILLADMKQSVISRFFLSRKRNFKQES